MPEPIMSRATLCRLFDAAAKEMARDDAILHVSGMTGHSVVTIEGVLASREARHNAAEVA